MTFLRKSGVAGILSIAMLVGADAQNRQDLVDAIGSAPEWTVVEAPVEYGRADLGTFSDPDRDALVEYGVRGVTTFGLRREGPDADDPVGITLYEMLDSSAAFGLFALKRDWRVADFEPVVAGTEAYRQNDRLHVWQSNYLLVADGPADDARDAALQLTEDIFGTSRKAPVSTYLPRQNLIVDSEQYILNPERFEAVTGVDPTLLGFDDSAEAAVAEYRTPEGGTARMAMLLYPTQHLASLHMDRWTGGGDGPWPNRRSGPLVGIALGTSDGALVETLLDAVHYESEVTWNAALPETLTLPEMILTIFSWIGIALVFTVVIGIGFGGLRIWLKTRYPDRFLGGSPSSELIQLHIDQDVTGKELTK